MELCTSFRAVLLFMGAIVLWFPKLKNDPILHNPYWPPVPTKIPSDFPKFKGKSEEDPQAHVMTYHLLEFPYFGKFGNTKR